LGPNTKNKSASFTVAVGYTDAVSTTTVNAGAVITAGGNVDVTSSLLKATSVNASAGSYEDGTVGIGVAVSVFRSNVASTIGGTVTAGGALDVEGTIQTNLDKTSASGDVGIGIFSKPYRKYKIAATGAKAAAVLQAGAGGLFVKLVGLINKKPASPAA